MRNYFARIKLLYFKKYRKIQHQKFEKNGKLGLIYNSELRREIGGVCASEANSQLSCVLKAMDAATEVDTYQRLSCDHSLLDHLPGGSLPSGVSHEISYPVRFNPNFYAFGAHWLRETRQHFKRINQQPVTGEADLCRK